MVRAEFVGNQTWSRNTEPVGFTARARLDVDARNSTEYGLLRAFMRLQLTNNSGASRWGNPAVQANTADTISPVLDKAFVQLGGLTAGRFSSFFDFYGGTGLFAGGIYGSNVSSISGFAYTQSFGNGFSATLSFEDANARVVVPTGNLGYTAAGESMPDVVANLRVDQSWGSAQLSAALHQVRPAYTSAFTSGSADYGWAIQGGAKINLPMIAAGDALWLQAGYAQGAMSYIGLSSTSFNVGRLNYAISDAFFANNTVQLTTGYALTATFIHYWTPTIRQALFGNYTQVDPTGSASQAVALASKSDLWQVGSNVVWSPVKGVDIGAEVMWFSLNGSKDVASTKVGTPVLSSADGWQYRLRVQREF